MSGGQQQLVLRDTLGPRVARLTLNKPERLNALGEELLSCLLLELDRCCRDDDVNVIVLAGAGRAFSSGGDLSPVRESKKVATASEEYVDRLRPVLDDFLRIWDAPKPVIAQVHGYCLGIAAALCSCVDLVVVADNATIGWPPPFGGGIIGPVWAYHVGARIAKEYSFQASSRLSGAEAARLGWANRSVPSDELEAVVRDLAVKIARAPSGVLRLKKAAINAVYDRMGFRETLRLGAAWDALAHTDPETDEVRTIIRELGPRGANEYYQRPADEESLLS